MRPSFRLDGFTSPQSTALSEIATLLGATPMDGASGAGPQPSDLCPNALHYPTDELKGFPLSATIAFNWTVAENVWRLEDGITSRAIHQADHPSAAIARDGTAR